jgi:hypothetical protein
MVWSWVDRFLGGSSQGYPGGYYGYYGYSQPSGGFNLSSSLLPIVLVIVVILVIAQVARKK